MVRRKSDQKDASPRLSPATTPELRENQMIALAEKEAERQLRNHTASSQVIVHYLKLGSTREKLEEQKLRHETEMLKAKTSSLNSVDEYKELVDKAIQAMKSYQGLTSGEEESDDHAD